MTAEQLKLLEARLWTAADELRQGSDLKSSQYATPILGLIFLRFLFIRYKKALPEIQAEFNLLVGGRAEQPERDIAIAKLGFYLPETARWDYLSALPESVGCGQSVKNAMDLLEKENPALADTLPKDDYLSLDDGTDQAILSRLLRIFSDIPEDVEGDLFGKIYEYFLAEFARTESQGGGEFFTPPSVVQLMVEIIEPYKGRVFDPACGSGGMFVQSKNFVERRKRELHDDDTIDLYVEGCEKTGDTVRLGKMNLLLNGIRGDIKQANTYYQDPFGALGKYDFVLANPPFNVDEVKLDAVKNDARFNQFGVPQNKSAVGGKGKSGKDADTVPNANYLWINLFASSLNDTGRAGLVMANSASDARHSEADIRKNLVRAGMIEVMLTLPKNMFYTVTLPATLWFFDKKKANRDTPPTVLFIDARNIFRQIDRAHRDFTPEQIQNIATIARLYRGENNRLVELLDRYRAEMTDFLAQTAQKHLEIAAPKQALADFVASGSEKKNDLARLERALAAVEAEHKTLADRADYFKNHIAWLTERFPDGKYADVTGLCKAASLADLEEQDFSLNPGRYVGVVIEDDGLTADEFRAEMHAAHAELAELHAQANALELAISQNFKLIGG
jgi:type I restriction enzyme M protein